jgi:large subunit ribosomal protein L7A
VIELLKKKAKVVGVKQTKKAAEQDQLEMVFIASDADQRVVAPIKQFCESKGIIVHVTSTMKQLGKAAGIDVGAAVAGILRSSN